MYPPTAPVYQCTNTPVHKCTSATLHQCTSAPVHQGTSAPLPGQGSSIWSLICHTRIKLSTAYCVHCATGALQHCHTLEVRCNKQLNKNQTLHCTLQRICFAAMHWEGVLHIKEGAPSTQTCSLRQKWSHSNVFNLFQLFFSSEMEGGRLLWRHKKEVGDEIWAKSELESSVIKSL